MVDDREDDVPPPDDARDRFSGLEQHLSDVFPARLKQAREEKGLSQREFAEAMGYAPTMISAFETGRRRMKLDDLGRACIVLDKEPHFFLGDPEPAREPVGLSLRAELAALPGEDLASSVEALLDRIEADVVADGGVPDLGDLRPAAAAREVLNHSGIDEPPVDMGEVCDSLGVPVYIEPLSESLSAFVLNRGEDSFTIAVNKNHAPTRRRFSVAHELGHAVLRHGASYYLEYSVDDAWEPPGYSYLDEREANQFAAALLMDERWVRTDFASGLRDVGTLADRYEVSPAAMGFRLLNLGLS